MPAAKLKAKDLLQMAPEDLQKETERRAINAARVKASRTRKAEQNRIQKESDAQVLSEQERQEEDRLLGTNNEDVSWLSFHQAYVACTGQWVGFTEKDFSRYHHHGDVSFRWFVSAKQADEVRKLFEDSFLYQWHTHDYIVDVANFAADDIVNDQINFAELKFKYDFILKQLRAGLDCEALYGGQLINKRWLSMAGPSLDSKLAAVESWLSANGFDPLWKPEESQTDCYGNAREWQTRWTWKPLELEEGWEYPRNGKWPQSVVFRKSLGIAIPQSVVIRPRQFEVQPQPKHQSATKFSFTNKSSPAVSAGFRI